VAAQVACTGWARLKAWVGRARAERTPNMRYMVVTLDVSKLSGWLNASASCRVERGAYDVRGEMRGRKVGGHMGLGWCKRHVH